MLSSRKKTLDPKKNDLQSSEQLEKTKVEQAHLKNQKEKIHHESEIIFHKAQVENANADAFGLFSVVCLLGIALAISGVGLPLVIAGLFSIGFAIFTFKAVKQEYHRQKACAAEQHLDSLNEWIKADEEMERTKINHLNHQKFKNSTHHCYSTFSSMQSSPGTTSTSSNNSSSSNRPDILNLRAKPPTVWQRICGFFSQHPLFKADPDAAPKASFDVHNIPPPAGP